MNIDNITHKNISPISNLEWYFDVLRKRNTKKYSTYIFAMKWFARILVLFHGKIAHAMNYQYAGLRIIDDRIDQDLPMLDTDIVLYAKKRFQILGALTSDSFVPGNPEDILLKEALKIAQQSNQQNHIKESIEKIIASMIFDAKRIQKYRNTNKLEFPEEKELVDHFYDLDIVGTGGGMLVYLGSKNIEQDIKRLGNIGKACRIEYNLHDLIEDLEHGIVNISFEDAKKYNISIADLVHLLKLESIYPVNQKDPAKIWTKDINRFPEPILNWIQGQINIYDDCIDIFMEKEFPTFPLITRFVFRKFYLDDIKPGIERLRTILESK